MSTYANTIIKIQKVYIRRVEQSRRDSALSFLVNPTVTREEAEREHASRSDGFAYDRDRALAEVAVWQADDAFAERGGS